MKNYALFATLQGSLFTYRGHSTERSEGITCNDFGKVDFDSLNHPVKFLMYLQSGAIRPPNMIVKINNIEEFDASTC